MKLTEKQKRFCDEYLISLNATEAAVKAGYSPRTARVIGPENLQKPVIQAFIRERLEKKDSERIMKQDEVLERLTEIGRGGDPDAKTSDVLKALELMGKRYGLFVDKKEIDVGEATLSRIEDMSLAERKERLDDLLNSFRDGSE